MNEYKKKLAAQTAGKVNSESAPEMTNGIPNSVLNDVFAGKKNPTSEMMGHKMPLPPSIAAKMQQSFGMDLTQLSVYQSDAMAGTGMKGVSQGNKVVLSSDIDLNTGEGQAVLGHELSHIHAQSQGIGTGHSGLYNNAALEAQADREGIMAAHGRPIYDHGMTGNPGMSYGLGMRGVEGITPLSGGLSASAGAPMQAKGFFDLFKSNNNDQAVPVADDEIPANVPVNVPAEVPANVLNEIPNESREDMLEREVDNKVKDAQHSGITPKTLKTGTEDDKRFDNFKVWYNNFIYTLGMRKKSDMPNGNENYSKLDDLSNDYLNIVQQMEESNTSTFTEEDELKYSRQLQKLFYTQEELANLGQNDELPEKIGVPKYTTYSKMKIRDEEKKKENEGYRQMEAQRSQGIHLNEANESESSGYFPTSGGYVGDYLGSMWLNDKMTANNKNNTEKMLKEEFTDKLDEYDKNVTGVRERRGLI